MFGMFFPVTVWIAIWLGWLSGDDLLEGQPCCHSPVRKHTTAGWPGWVDLGNSLISEFEGWPYCCLCFDGENYRAVRSVKTEQLVSLNDWFGGRCKIIVAEILYWVPFATTLIQPSLSMTTYFLMRAMKCNIIWLYLHDFISDELYR